MSAQASISNLSAIFEMPDDTNDDDDDDMSLVFQLKGSLVMYAETQRREIEHDSFKCRINSVLPVILKTYLPC